MRIVLFILSMFGWAHIVCSCVKHPEPPPLPDYCYSEDALIAEVLKCTAKSDTRAASKLCRQALYRSCGIVETLSAGAHP